MWGGKERGGEGRAESIEGGEAEEEVDMETRPCFGLDSGLAFALIRPFLGRVSAFLWHFFGLILAFPWPCFGLSLAFLWPYLGLSLASLWPYFGLSLALSWPYFGLILALFWPYFGLILASLGPRLGGERGGGQTPLQQTPPNTHTRVGDL